MASGKPPAGTSIANFSVGIADLQYTGRDLKRPECVLATASGELFVADGRGGVATVRPGGEVRLIVGQGGPEGFLPNGIALLPDRSFLIANIGPEGGVWHLAPDGTLTPHLLEVEGRTLPPTNFVGVDADGRTWITLSTWHVPRQEIARQGWADGFVILLDRRGARIAADGIAYTNEAKVDPSRQWLYVVETVGRRLSRHRLRADSSLGPRETVTEFGGEATFPDGLTFDAEGGAWITCVVSNRIIRVDCGSGTQQLILDDSHPEHVRQAEARYQAGGLPGINDPGPDRTLPNPASLAFGDADLRTVYIGTVHGTRIAHFRSPIRGAEPVHWRY